MSHKKAIEEMCKWCIYDKSQDGTWRSQVEDCTSYKCPLFEYRPITQATLNQKRKDNRKA